MQETQVRSLGWKDPWRKWQPTSVFLPEKFHGQRSLVVCGPWGVSKSQTRLNDWACMHILTHAASKDLVCMWPVATLCYLLNLVLAKKAAESSCDALAWCLGIEVSSWFWTTSYSSLFSVLRGRQESQLETTYYQLILKT